MVTPTALYGSGTWAMTASGDQALRTAQRKMLLRSILGSGRKSIESSSDSSFSLDLLEEQIDEDELLESWLQWKQRTTREALGILEKIGIPDWADEQRRRQWKWAGHVARRRDGRWTTQVVYWAPHGYRRQGHPRRRWEDVLQEYLVRSFGHSHWMRCAGDRTWWREQEDAFVASC